MVKACRSGKSKSNYAILVADILRLRDPFDRCGFLWSRREANNAAHEVARLSLAGEISYDWPHRFPLSLQRILEMDRPD